MDFRQLFPSNVSLIAINFSLSVCVVEHHNFDVLFYFIQYKIFSVFLIFVNQHDV